MPLSLAMGDKVLCLCEGGTIRSVSLALLLKQRGMDALAASTRFNTPDTLKTLCAWADRIIVVQEEFMEAVPKSARAKAAVYDVGPDLFQNPLAAALCRMHMKWLWRDPAMPRELRKSIADELMRMGELNVGDVL